MNNEDYKTILDLTVNLKNMLATFSKVYNKEIEIEISVSPPNRSIFTIKEYDYEPYNNNEDDTE